jgi:signal transduction histidine kinase
VSHCDVDAATGWLPLQELEPLKTRSVSHELTNPFETVVNFLYLIREDRNDAEQVLRWVDLADVQLRKIAEILRRGAQ